MNINIIEKKEALLLHRLEVAAEADFEGATPSKQEVKSKIAASLKADEKLVVVKHIYNTYGLKKARVLLYKYENEKVLKEIEPKKKEAKGKKKEGEKK